MIHRRTKIICTIGPAVETLEKMLALIDAGMNVARLNFSHGTQEEHLERIQNLKKAREMRKMPLAIMLDTKGPEIRLGQIKGDAVQVNAKQSLLLTRQVVQGDAKKVSVFPGSILDSLRVGDKILFDDGYIISKVIEMHKDGIVIEIQNSGMLKSQKSVNIPGVSIDLPAMTEQDVEDITFGCQQDIDLIAASFIRSAEHVKKIKQLLVRNKKQHIQVIAKIENRLGVENFDSILQIADGIMVARGDLGVELPIQEVPVLQKMMIRKCLAAAKPVVTATQMLESMMKNPRPTRAEASDVANAIYDSTSAVMLSGETAAGQYPVETVEMMRLIVEEAEKDFPYREFFYRHFQTDSHDISSSISLATVKTAYSAGAKAIFVFTNKGFTARLISSCRPQIPILALTSNLKTYHQLAFHWGVIPLDPQETENVREAFKITSEAAQKRNIVQYGDLVVVTAGSPFGITGTTNMMIVESIGDVLVRGHPNKGERIQGKVAFVLSAEEWKQKKGHDRIAVISHADDSYLEVLQDAKAVILQNYPDDLESEKWLIKHAEVFGMPFLVRADHALNRLQEGQVVILDPEKGIVYKKSSHDDEMIPGISDTD